MNNETIEFESFEFEDFEFEKPPFEIKLYEYFDGILYGRVFDGTIWIPKRWKIFNKIAHDSNGNYQYNLVLSDKDWYKDPNNFPAWVVFQEKVFECTHVVNRAAHLYGRGTVNIEDIRLAEKEEILNLFYKDKR